MVAIYSNVTVFVIFENYGPMLPPAHSPHQAVHFSKYTDSSYNASDISS